MEILDKKSNRMSRANSGVSERSEFPDLQRILDFLSLRNLLSNELFFTFYYFVTIFLFFFNFLWVYLFCRIYYIIMVRQIKLIMLPQLDQILLLLPYLKIEDQTLMVSYLIQLFLLQV